MIEIDYILSTQVPIEKLETPILEFIETIRAITIAASLYGLE
jgi:hypothetical protein